MASHDPRIDAYIDQAPEFARPILRELRARVHATCPDTVETLKWRTPAFEHAGLLAGMAAFKAYCSFAFWKEQLLRKDPALAAVLDRCGKMTAVTDLPARPAFAKALRRAAQLNSDGVAVPKGRQAPKPAIAMPREFARALAANKQAKASFDGFSPSHKREYLEWIVDARKDETRARRIEQAIAWLTQGKHRNWRYEQS
jgi:uncharacterized protein YdeI (YjbR/CyaY-like superfamily)